MKKILLLTGLLIIIISIVCSCSDGMGDTPTPGRSELPPLTDCVPSSPVPNITTPAPTEKPTPTPTPTPIPTPTLTPDVTPTPTDDEPPVKNDYEQFGGKYINSELYRTNFEVWPGEDNGTWCGRAFFQMVISLNDEDFSAKEGFGTADYKYKFVVYYREAGSKAEFKGGYTVPVETMWDSGTGGLYRLQIAEAPEGNPISSWMVGGNYEIVVQYLKDGVSQGYSNYTFTWTEEYRQEYKMYETFWKRHDRSEGYTTGLHAFTDADRNDPYGTTGDFGDDLDRTQMKPIGSQNTGYGSIIREKSTGEILFSPEISDIRNILSGYSAGEHISEYKARLVFTVMDYNGNEFYTYPALELPMIESKGEWFDFYLQGDGIDSGFCPQAGRMYSVYLEILNEAGTKVLYYGYYTNINVSESLADNKYYKGIPIPGEENIEYTVSFEVRDGVGGSIKGETTQTFKYGEMTTAVEAVPENGYVFLQWSDGSTNPKRPAEKVTRSKNIVAIFIKESAKSAVADMYITTDTGKPITSKNYVTGTVKIVSANKDFSLDTVTMQIRGRGNSSFNGGASQSNYDSKNSYRLKLDEKAELLGLGSSNKDWVLNSNKFDAVGLRCFATWQLASYMDTLPFCTDCSWVNMYINGEYRGMYMVTELIEVADGRVEVEDDINSTDKGFLIELDFRGDGEGGVLGLDYFYISGYESPSDTKDNAVEFVIKSNVDSEDDTSAIKKYVTLCHNAIMSGSRVQIEQYVDLASLIDMFILEELSKDVDVGCASFFIQRDVGGKLYFTAPWDFDFGYGTYGPGVNYTGFHSEGSSRCVWFKHLIRQGWFRQAVLERMEELDSAFDLTIKDVKAKGEELYFAGDRNAVFWNMYGNHFHSYVSGQVSSDLHSYQQHIDFLVAWMEARWIWMKDNL